MSSLVMSTAEEKEIDHKVEGMLDWAKTRQYEAEQLAMDAARLLSCTSERMDTVSRQGFFRRCWGRFSGETAAAERANTGDLIQMQKISLRYINMLQEQQLMLAHSMLTLKNNLLSLAVKEEETRKLVGLLAQRTLERFEKLEHRVDQLEISNNLQGWLLTLEERDYDEKFPTKYMRLFRVINDFYSLKNDAWNYNDLMFMRKAIRMVNIDPREKLSLDFFIDSLTDEIQNEGVGFDSYGEAITLFKPLGVENYSHFAVENISSPVFTAMHGLKNQYMDRLDIVEALQDEMHISASEALKRLLRRSINNLNVDLSYKFPLAETAIEILGCLRLAEKLSQPAIVADNAASEAVQPVAESIESASNNDNVEEDKGASACASPKVDVRNLTMSPWRKVTGHPFATPEYSWSWGSYLAKQVLPHSGGWYFLTSEAIYTSDSELKKWEKIYNVTGYPDGLRSPDNEHYFLMQGSQCFLLREDGHLAELPLPKEYMGEDIYYFNVFYDGNTWFVCGTFSASYTYTDGKLFKSTKKYGYESLIIFSGTDLDKLRPYAFMQDFPMYDARNCHFIDGQLVVVLKSEKNSDDVKIAVSKDGFSWHTFPIEDAEDLNYYFSSTFNNQLLFSDINSRKLCRLSLEQQKFISIDFNINRISTDIIPFESSGVAVLESWHQELSIYISNDLSFWQELDVPVEVRKKEQNIAYNGRHMLVIGKENIWIRDLY